ncbi:MAG: PGPGW domain-containing protein [Syntrophales bacterium]|nr:PGPGW domain-containing protein [Syntrophales bacterium]MDD5534084.1 PGPGW domain-containing protein [Syntrophales bacterium]HPL64525.1 PGPGW domain-containing protein [Syntrophales bacterium]
MKRTIRLAAGWIFIVLGVLGLFLPFLQGILFLFIGMLLLAPDVPLFRRILEKLKEKHPGFFRKAHDLIHRFHKR